jgi:hypothetical protein
MADIKNTRVYSKENEPTLSDFLIGTKSSNGKTKNFSLEAILQLLNSSNGVNNIQFKFSNGSHPNIDYLTDGYFFTNTNDIDVGSFTELIFNKKTIQYLDLSPLFNKLGELENVVIKLENIEDPNNFFNFKINSFEDSEDFFVFGVDVFIDLYLGELINEKNYNFYFDVKSSSSIEELSEQLDFEANGIDDFIDIGTTAKPRAFFDNSVLKPRNYWSQTGTVINFTYVPDAGAGYKNLTFI